ALPAEDRPLVARALSKSPEQRFPSCLDFLQALVCGCDNGGNGPQVDLPRRASSMKKIVSAALPAEEKPTRLLRRLPTPLPSAPGGGTLTGTGTVVVRSETIPSSPLLPPEPERPRVPAARTGPTPGPLGTLRPGVPASPEPTCVSLPGYHFLSCVSQNP